MAGGHLWTDDEADFCARLWAMGYSNQEVWEKHRESGKFPRRGVQAVAKARTQVELVRTAIEKAEKNYTTPQRVERALAGEHEPHITMEYVEKPTALTVEALWKRAEVQTKAQVEWHQNRHFATIRFKTDHPIGISFVADQHISQGGPVLLERMRQDAELIRDTPGLYAILGGDGVDNHIKHQSAMVNSESRPGNEWKMYDHYLSMFGHKVVGAISGNHCLSDDSEALTQDGWKRWHEIDPRTDMLWSINPKTRVGEWCPIERWLVREHTGGMVHIEGQSVDLLCTDEHRVLRYSKRGNVMWSKAKDLPRGRVILPVSSGNDNVDVDIPDDMIRVAAWILTDGWVQEPHGYIRLAQRTSNVHKFTDALDGLGIEYRVVERNRQTTEIMGVALKSVAPASEVWLGADASRQIHPYLRKKRELPPWTNNLSTRQFSVFLDALIDGDGSTYPHTDATVLYGKPQFLEQVQALAVRHGYSASMSNPRDNDWRLNLAKRNTVEFDGTGRATTVDYSGMVWCPTVKHGNFMSRRNGKPHFTGNCDWTQDVTGLDAVSMLMKRNRIWFAPDFFVLTVELETSSGHVQSYVVKIRHQYRFNSTLNETHSVKQMLRFDDHDFDIGVLCHKHKWAYEEFEHNGLERVALRPGSYQVTSGYSRRYGYGQSTPTCPTVILWPGERKLRGSRDVHEEADYLKYLRLNQSRSAV